MNSEEQDILWSGALLPDNEGLHPIIRMRYSARSYRRESLTLEQIQVLIRAACWSSSSMNAQPWRYSVALRSDAALFESFLDCLLPSNRAWAKDCGALLMSAAYTWLPAFNMKNSLALHDVGAANTTLLLQAVSMGISGRMMAGFDAERTRDYFGFSEHLEPVCFIALGYPAPSALLDEPIRMKDLQARTRMQPDEICFKPGGLKRD
jgi:nitroreductase